MPAPTTAPLQLDRVTRRYPTQVAVSNLSLDVRAGELLALLGASGSGKTTTLRMIAGYELPDEGRIQLDSADITRLPPEKRGFGMVFQHYALFPHLTVRENVAFGLEARGVATRVRHMRAGEALEQVGLGAKADRAVQALSGGEQQRVALARALVIEPRVLLLDEPLSNLDPTLREGMRTELRRILTQAGTTGVFVTHDQEDAFAVADRIALLEHGHLLQHAPADEMFDRPASAAVARFIGRATLVPATDNGDTATIMLGGVRCTLDASRPHTAGQFANALAVLRPHALDLRSADAAEGWPARITHARFAGGTTQYLVETSDREGARVELEVSSRQRGGAVGDTVRVVLDRPPVPLVAAL
jgi:putative spermidine/putrescine transport system ATP-binding protein